MVGGVDRGIADMRITRKLVLGVRRAGVAWKAQALMGRGVTVRCGEVWRSAAWCGVVGKERSAGDSGEFNEGQKAGSHASLPSGARQVAHERGQGRSLQGCLGAYPAAVRQGGSSP